MILPCKCVVGYLFLSGYVPVLTHIGTARHDELTGNHLDDSPNQEAETASGVSVRGRDASPLFFPSRFFKLAWMKP